MKMPHRTPQPIPVLAGALLGLSGCSTDVNSGASDLAEGLGPADSTSTTAASTGSDSDGSTVVSGDTDQTDGINETGAAGCDDGGGCLAAPPDGWSGPVAYARSASLGATPSCPPGFRDSLTLLEGPSAVAPAVCECSCGTTAALDCYGYAYSIAA